MKNSLITIVVTVSVVVASCASFKKTTSSIKQEALALIYEEAINNSYEYMFAERGEKMSISGVQKGKFQGGFKGILLYSSFKKGIRNYLSEQGEDLSGVSNSFYDLDMYEALSGTKCSVHGQTELKTWRGDFKEVDWKFLHYNPEIIRWGIDNMIIEPETMIGDQTAQAVYDFHLNPFFENLLSAHVWLEEIGFEEEANRYQEAMQDPEFNGLQYLFDNYFDPYEELNYNQFNYSMAAGFWLRRELDGTREMFYDGMSKVLTKYNPELLKNYEDIRTN